MTTETRQLSEPRPNRPVRVGRGNAIHAAYQSATNRTYCGAEAGQRGYSPLTTVEAPVTCRKCLAALTSVPS